MAHVTPVLSRQAPACVCRVLMAVALSVAALLASLAATAAPAQRLITLAPHITELIFAAGAGERIVATVLSSDYPVAARAIARIGNGMNVSVEKIIAFAPDLVAAWRPGGAARTVAPALARLHIPLVYADPHTLGDIPDEIVSLGRRLGTEKIAGPVARRLNSRIDALRTTYSHRAPVSVFIEVGVAPLYTIGADPLLNDALRSCGGVNVYRDSQLAAPQVSVESLLMIQPDVIITTARGAAQLATRRNDWSALQLRAALKQHVYAIDPDELFRPGPRLIDATEKLCQYLDRAR